MPRGIRKKKLDPKPIPFNPQEFLADTPAAQECTNHVYDPTRATFIVPGWLKKLSKQELQQRVLRVEQMESQAVRDANVERTKRQEVERQLYRERAIVDRIVGKF